MRWDRDAEQCFVEHMALCDGCARYVDQSRQTVAQLGRLPDENGLSGEARDRVLAAFRNWARA